MRWHPRQARCSSYEFGGDHHGVFPAEVLRHAGIGALFDICTDAPPDGGCEVCIDPTLKANMILSSWWPQRPTSTDAAEARAIATGLSGLCGVFLKRVSLHLHADNASRLFSVLHHPTCTYVANEELHQSPLLLNAPLPPPTWHLRGAWPTPTSPSCGKQRSTFGGLGEIVLHAWEYRRKVNGPSPL